MKQTKRFLALGMAACLLLLGACGNNGAGAVSYTHLFHSRLTCSASKTLVRAGFKMSPMT